MFLEIIIHNYTRYLWYGGCGLDNREPISKVRRWLTWSSKSSRYLRIKVYFFWPSQSLDQFVNGRGGEVIPIGSTLSFRDLERSLSLTSWIVSFSNFLLRKRMACCCNWGWVLFLKLYLGSEVGLMFICWCESSSLILEYLPLIISRLLYSPKECLNLRFYWRNQENLSLVLWRFVFQQRGIKSLDLAINRVILRMILS